MKTADAAMMPMPPAPALTTGHKSVKDQLVVMAAMATRFTDMVQELQAKLAPEQLRSAVKPVLLARINVVIEEVARFYGMAPAMLIGPSRHQPLAFQRQVAMYLTRKHTSSSLVSVGHAFKGRDHGTVLHGCQKVADQMASYPKVMKEVSECDNAVQAALARYEEARREM